MAKRSVRRKKSGPPAPANQAGAVLPPAWYENPWVLGLGLVLAVILVYTPVWYAGFIWDDDDHVTANPCIVGPLGLWEIWTTSDANFFPLTLTTFWFEHALWGVVPLPYHIVTILLHAGAVVVLWRVLLALKIPGAWLGAALWAVHPVEVESVAWISETKNTQSGLFFLLAILFFIRWLKAVGPKTRTPRGWDYALTLIFAALAMASKSSTAILPAVLCLCAWWIEGRWQWRNLLRTAPIFAMSIVGSALAAWTQTVELAAMADPQWDRSWAERFAAAGDAVWFYLGKLISPYPLSIIYPRWHIDANPATAYIGLIAALAVGLILWLERNTARRPVFFVYAYFLVTLLPGLGLVDNSIFRYSLVFDHFQYLASIGPLALVGAGLARWIARQGTARWRGVTVTGLMFALAGMSWGRVWAYRDPQTLWTDTLAKNPQCWAAENNLGNMLAVAGRYDEAVVHIQKALAINPSDAEAECNFGNCLYQQGAIDGAILHYQRALAINPNYRDATNNLGCAFLKQGRTAQAVVQFEKAVEIDPNYVQARTNLARAQAIASQAERSK